MGVFHYKANLLKQDETRVFYKFYPEFIDCEEVNGEFQIDLQSWKTTIILETQIDGRDKIFCNDRPVSALTYKIKKYFEENYDFPTEVFHTS